MKTQTNKHAAFRAFCLFLLLCFTKVSFAQIPATGLNFDGVDDYIEMPADPRLDDLGKNALTLQVLVNINDVGPVNSIFRKSGDYNLYVLNGRVHLELWTGGIGDPTRTTAIGTALIQNGIWANITATWDGVTPKFYIDGVPDPVTIVNDAISTNEPFYIGYSRDYSQPIAGTMDEIRVWNRALSASEILTNLVCELNPLGRSGLLLYYKLNSGYLNDDNTAFSFAVDETANHLDGALKSFALTGLVSNWSVGTAAGTCGVFTLPVKLVTFSATKKEGKNLLSWETGSETNFKGFSVEKSEGDAFQTIGYVAVKGVSSSPRQYGFEDAYPSRSVSYYRLKMTDNDGLAHYSKTVAVNNVRPAGISVFPNPAQNNLFVTGCANGATFTIKNTIGQVVQKGTLQSGEAVPVSSLARGMYVVTIEGQSLKFFKL